MDFFDDEPNHEEIIIKMGSESHFTTGHSSQALLKDLGIEISSLRHSQDKVLKYKEN